MKYVLKYPPEQLHLFQRTDDPDKDDQSFEEEIERLRKSEARYRFLVEYSYDMVWSLDADGVFTYASPSWLRNLGIENSAVVGRTFQSFIHPEDAKLGEAYLRTLGRSGEAAPGPECRVRRADGSWRWHTANASPVFDEGGSLVSFIGISRDITEQRQVEEDLKESRQFFLDIINFLPDPTYVIDMDSKVIAWNRAMEAMTDVPASEMIGKGNYEYAFAIYGERRPLLIDLVLNPRDGIEAYYKMHDGREDIIEGETYTPDLKGREAYLYCKASVLRDSKGHVVGAIESIHDRTAHRQAEEHYREIFENAMIGIGQVAPDGRLIRVNPAFAHMLGYDTPEEVINAVTNIAGQVYADRHLELLKRMNETGQIRDLAVKFYRKDGSIAWIAGNGRTVKDHRGKVLYYEGTIQDISEYKAMEDHLRQSQKMEAIGTLAGGIAHDFNNILSAILGYAELALREPVAGDRLHRYIDLIHKGALRAADLVQQILTFSRQSEEKLFPLKAGPVMKEAIKLLRATIPTSIEIEQQIQTDTDVIMANPSYVHQILMNLCTNAMHAMKEKKGILAVSLTVEDVKTGDRLIGHGLTPGRHLKLSVSDTGEGIEPGIMDKIFDPFFTTKKPGEGTGMGLSVVHGIVKKCKGAVTVQSELGKGTSFQVYFPLLIETEKAPTARTNEDIARGTERILYVDDDEVVSLLGFSMLTSLGYEVVTRTNSEEALELFRSDPGAFDLVVTDMTMPRLTGVDLAGHMLRIRPNLPIILCTGFSEQVAPDDAKPFGFREIIMKPFSLDRLAASIRRELDANL